MNFFFSCLPIGVDVSNFSEMLPVNTCGKMVMVNGKNIALFFIDGRFYAVDEQCPHLGRYRGIVMYCCYCVVVLVLVLFVVFAVVVFVAVVVAVAIAAAAAVASMKVLNFSS